MFEIVKNLQLTDFSSLFEIAATLNLVYVVAEHAKQYGSTLTKNFYQSGINIEKEFNECYSVIDKESVQTMPAIMVGNSSTEGQIQKVKRDIHKLEESKKTRIDRLKEQTDSRCILKSFSFISLYMFLFSLFSLFVGGLNETIFMKAYMVTYTILSIVVLVVVSVFGEKEEANWITRNLSLTKCCKAFLLITLFSFISYFFRTEIDVYSFLYWPVIILLCALFPYMAFVIFMMIIRNRLIGLSAELKKEIDEFNLECKSVEEHISQLKNAYELSVSMEADDSNIEEDLRTDNK